MKLVLCYEAGDGYTYHFTESLPFEYESREKFLYDLLEATLKAVENETAVKIIGQDFSILNFGYFSESRPGTKNPKPHFEFSEPRVYTLEEWFTCFEAKETASD